MADHAAALAVCHALAAKGIMIQLVPEEGTLILSPVHLVEQHPALLQEVRAHKPAILAAMLDCLVMGVLDTPGSGRLVTERCPVCEQPTFVVSPPRRLGVHRTQDGRHECPGSVQEQERVTRTLMGAFMQECLIKRPGSIVSWMALRGCLEPWACVKGLLLPPRPYILAWLDGAFTRTGKDETYPSWAGVTFQLKEWGLEDEPAEAPVQAPKGKRRAKLRA